MNNRFPDIPIVAIGPGSQVGEADDALDYMNMPSDMSTYRTPMLPEPDEVEDCTAAYAVLEDILIALRAYRRGDASRIVALESLQGADLEFVNQALGEGEVSVTFKGASQIRAQEAVLAGVWRVRHFDDFGQLVFDSVEVGDVPGIVRETARSCADSPVDTQVPSDLGIQNAPALLIELEEKINSYRRDDPLHTINLSLLPLSDADLMLIGERLGVGAITILSRGYGNCRIGSTEKPNTWWIKYYNSQDALILNTIEIVEVPEVAMAAPEDIADSAERLDEILALYR